MKFPILSLKDNFKIIVILAAVVYIITAFNSHGFYHADEQYQIIEFAGLKLGTHTPVDLAWEFKAQIRPALQPISCFVLLKSFDYFNISNPYSQAFLLRLLSAIFAILIISFFVQNTKDRIISKRVQTGYYLLSFFLWFIPVISVRVSSETWSGLFFLLSLACFFNDSNKKIKPVLFGLTLGVSFLLRFQIAFAVVGFGFWLVIVNHSKLNYLIKIIASFCAVVFLGFLLDIWFYGEIVFTPWYYFISIIESGGDGFGSSPWYFYLLKLLSYPSYFVGIPIVLSIVLLIIFKPKSFLLWSIIPYILIHSFVPHKEERFLFPIVFLFPIILIEGYLIITKIITNRGLIKAFNIVLVSIFVSVNLIGLIAMAQKAAGLGRMEITKYIHDNYGDKKINLVHCSWADPYNPWEGLPIRFYLEDSMTEYRIENLCELNDSLFKNDVVNLLVIQKRHKKNRKCTDIINSGSYIFETQSVPGWIEKLNSKYKGFDNQSILELYRYVNNE